MDDFGNASICMVSVMVTDSMNRCPLPRGDINGFVRYENNEPMSFTQVQISGRENLILETDIDGMFGVEDLDPNVPVSIVPINDSDHTGGISTYDVLLIQKHLLGLELLDSPYKLIAADANGNKRVNASDLFELRKLILAESEELPSTTSYVFIPTEMVFIDQMNPWYNGRIFGATLNMSSGSQFVDLMGIKVGDVNKSHHTSSPRNRTTREWTYQVTALSDDRVRVDFFSDDNSIEGMQTTISFDPESMDFIGTSKGLIDLDDQYVSTKKTGDGVLPISWSSGTSMLISPRDPLFSLEFVLKNPGHAVDLTMDNSPTRSEVYQSGQIHDLVLKGQERKLNIDHVQTPSNIPNPWSQFTRIQFALGQTADVNITIYDSSMREIWTATNNYSKGSHSVQVDHSVIPDGGIYFYEVSSRHFTKVSKMIKVN